MPAAKKKAVVRKAQPEKKAAAPAAKAKGPKVNIKVPASLGEAIDLLDKLRDERLELGAKLADVKAREDFIEGAIFNRFEKSKLEGGRGKIAQASISMQEVPTIEDSDAFYGYIKKSGELDLLQRRVSSTAVRERWKAGKVVPGVGKFTKISLSLTKLRNKK